MGFRYPVAVYELEKGNRGFSSGARIRLDQVDGSQWWFRSLAGAQAFMAAHGMVHINEGEMTALRQALKESERS